MPVYPVRRRPRECKTCLPCRASKVRCDRNVPCSNCVKRNFSCTYGRPSLSHASKPPLLSDPFATATATATTSAGPSPQFPPPSSFTPAGGDGGRYSFASTSVGDYGGPDPDPHASSDMVSLSQMEWDEVNAKMQAMEQIVTSLHSLFQNHSERRPTDPRSVTLASDDGMSSSGAYDSSRLETGEVHIGSRSALLDILGKTKGSQEAAQGLPTGELLAELAMGNESAAYPFVDLWSSDPFTFNIAGVCDVLPDDIQCRRFFDFYKDIGAVLYPVLPNVRRVEDEMNRLLQNRANAGGVYKPDSSGLMKPFGMSLPFLSLLFAVLASGCQLSDLSGSERRLTSWVYVSCSYQCLRMVNYVSHPTVDVIQILLIISNVLSYNMNAGASYTLLGMTERMCMVLGLHVESPGFSIGAKAARRRVWWAMAFQNSHFSLAYDRPSITMINQPEIPYDPKSMPGHRSYFETLCRVISVALEMLRGLLFHHHTHLRYHEIREYKQQIERITTEAAPHLRQRENCRTLADHIERTELQLHSSYYISLMCRVSLDPDAPLDDQRRAIIRGDCLTNLMRTIEAFIELHSINTHCSRSWISLQRTIASAFLLVAHNNAAVHPQTWDLIQRLENVLADHVHANGEESENSQTDSAKHLASSLRALREVSAAFRAREKGMSAPETAQVTPNYPTAFDMISPASVPPEATESLYTGAGYPVYMDDSHIEGILNRVSDVMLFPSMNMGNV
ncbi:cellobiose response regulator [Aspergillus campestris IBT 28561]|uniref:Cellobiose response regulator n=1 Tax=Aspergillus campestris (strain IBT 28561) TaxID=1392248 RepID=A0A2I1CQG6_ASPC2|nr:cellobiose response regulator [Aspergillus campestris IBT 28561]PKX99869.1 cellobiose response regulator [Aspergillus campestris IBT 28561]